MAFTIQIIIVIVIVLLTILLYIKQSNGEKFAGALTQLSAKGPMDTYLSADSAKYVPEWRIGYNFPYRYFRKRPIHKSWYYYPFRPYNPYYRFSIPHY